MAEDDYIEGKAITGDFIDAFLDLAQSASTSEIKAIDVCRRAGYSRSSFYRRFNGIEDLKAVTMRELSPYRVQSRVLQATDPVPSEAATQICEFYDSRVSLVSKMSKTDMKDEYFELQAKVLLPIFTKLFGEAFELASVQERLIMDYLAHSRSYLLRLWAEDGCTIPLGELNMMLVTTVERGTWESVEQVPGSSER